MTEPTKAEEMISKTDKFRFCVHSGILGCTTQLGGVMANADFHSINIDILIASTAVVFFMHYSKEAKNFIAAKMEKDKEKKQKSHN